MDIRRYTSFAAAVVMALSAVSCNSKKSGGEDENSGSSDAVSESITDISGSTEIIPVETYPEVEVTYPAIEAKDTWDFYEAENARCSSGLEVASSKKNFSGKGYITGFPSDGTGFVSFSVEAPSNQHYDLSFNIAADKAVKCRVSLNGTRLTDFTTKSDGKFTQITVHGVFLTKGRSNIDVSPEDGNICIDHMKLANSSSLAEISYDATDKLSNKNAAKAAKELMTFLSENYGKYTITGQYASAPDNAELDLIYKTTGKYPVIRFTNFSIPEGNLDESFRYVDACADWYRNGGISCVSWFWNSPSKKSGIRTEDTDFSLADAVTDEDIALLTEEEIRGLYGEGKIPEQCYSLILDIDRMAGQLTSLKNKGVPVLWRPLPEGSGDWYWWGASGEKAYKWLWKLMYTRMTGFFELDNLIWIWNGQSADTLVDKDTFDIAAVDLYVNDASNYGDRFYERFAAVQKFAGTDKLIALSECGSVPDIDAEFRDNAVWSFFGLWFGKYVRDEKGGYSEEFTSKENLIRCYNSKGAMTLDEYRSLSGYKEEVTTEASSETETEETSEAPSGTEDTSAPSEEKTSAETSSTEPEE